MNSAELARERDHHGGLDVGAVAVGTGWAARWSIAAGARSQVAGLIQRRIPARRAHVVGLSLGGAVAHTFQADDAQQAQRAVDTDPFVQEGS